MLISNKRREAAAGIKELSFGHVLLRSLQNGCLQFPSRDPFYRYDLSAFFVLSLWQSIADSHKAIDRHNEVNP